MVVVDIKTLVFRQVDHRAVGQKDRETGPVLWKQELSGMGAASRDRQRESRKPQKRMSSYNGQR